MGVTQEEITEVLHVAMTVGATRMQVMAKAEAAKLEPAAPTPATPAPATPPAAAAAPLSAAPTGPTFQAAGVVAQADGG